MLLTREVLTALSELGLNKYEAKVYLTLITEGISTAKNISDITSIPYGKVYEIINTLASKGLAIVLPTKPMKCQAISPRESITTLKKDYQEKIEKFETVVLKELEPIFTKSKKFVEPQGIFWVMKGRSNINKKMEDMIRKEIKQMTEKLVEKGMYKSQSEVVRDAIRQLSLKYGMVKTNIEKIRKKNSEIIKKSGKTLSQTVREIRNEA